MKKLPLLLAFSAFSLVLFAADGPKSKTRSRAPHNFIMMRQGKLFEVNHGIKKPMTKDVTLVNQTTIHPNGSIDASSGQTLQLKEGEYITMDGKIRRLKNMPKYATRMSKQ